VDGAPARRARIAILAAVYGLAAAVLILHQRGRVVPDGFIDELTYGRVAQNLAAGDGFTYQGLSPGYRSLYPYVIAPAWALLDGSAAYHAALALNAGLMNLVVFPTYAIARRVAPFWWATAAAAAAALTPSMVWSAYLLTEALAYPLAAAAIWAMVRALHDPAWRWTAAALALCLLCALTRTHLLILFVAFGLAVAIDVARAGRGELHERARERRFALAALAVLIVLGAAVALTGARETALGTYASTLEHTGGPLELLRLAGQYVGVIAVVGLLTPLLALVAHAAGRRGWRDPELGPLLCVGLGALFALLAIGAWSTATISPELRERYVFYGTPVFAACWAALPGRVSARTLGAITLGAVAYLVLVPDGAGRRDEFVGYTIGSLADRALGVGSIVSRSPLGGVDAWAACALVVGLAATAGLRSGGRRAAVLLVVPTLAFGAGVLHTRQRDSNLSSARFAKRYPQPPDWIARNSAGPAAFVMTRGTDRFAIWHAELWNPSLDRVFRTVGTDELNGIGQACLLAEAGPGVLRTREPCAGRELPRVLAFQDSAATIEVANGRLLYAGPAGTRLYEIPPGVEPRLAGTE
jgi:hypothetical protein